MSTAANQPAAEYRRRLQERLAQARAAETRHLLLSWSRLAVFVLGLGVAWLAAVRPAVSAAWVMVPVVGFLALMAIHSRVMAARQRATRAAAHYRRALERLDNHWAGRGIQGERYQDPRHLYAADLDLFGPGSLFELLCAARTRVGEATLAGWLLSPAAPSLIRARQAAVVELRPRLDLREDLALLGDAVQAEVDAAALGRWCALPARLPGGGVRLAALLVTLVVMGVAIAWLAGMVGARTCIGALLGQALWALVWRRRVRQALESADRPVHGLEVLAQVMGRLEQESFAAPMLVAQRAALAASGRAPSRQMNRLAWIQELLDWRLNQMFAPLAACLMWTTHLAFALESWRRRVGPTVPVWVEALGQLEALCSLAGHAYEHPADPFASIDESGGATRFSATGLGHPLLADESCIRNDVELGQDLRLLVVSGSNMSGKSTLLRTVGINTVMALAGAPVRARGLTLTPMTVGASIRIQDSLMEGHSRFYAEITRLRQIVDAAAVGPAVLFLLDEVLHGTNSHDRRIGAEAVVRGLLARGAVGLVTTHDLALAQVADALAPVAANIHFQDELTAGRMTFDYRIHPGVVTRSNALALMEAVGLDVGERGAP